IGVDIVPLSVNILPHLAFVFDDVFNNLKNISKFYYNYNYNSIS
mgnify:CR=1